MNLENSTPPPSQKKSKGINIDTFTTDNAFDKLVSAWGLLGTTENVLREIGNPSSSQVFFKPFQRRTTPLIGFITIITAPIIYSIIALEFILATLFFIGKSLVNLIQSNFSQATDDLIDAGVALWIAGISILTAACSSFINLVDFLGSVVVSLFMPSVTEQDSEQSENSNLTAFNN